MTKQAAAPKCIVLDRPRTRADDPVRRGVSIQSLMPAITGCPAFAGHDGEQEEQLMTAHRKPANEAATTFARRHIGPSPRDVSAMLETRGRESLDELIGQTLPSSIRQKAPLDLGRALSETEALAHMRELASQNQVFTSLIGQGYSGTILPAVIQRNILENPAWYTAYTPYQPEISQGRLEALFNFQTMICDLTGLDVANASLLDEATAAAEAMALARARRAVKGQIVLRRPRGASADAGGAAHPRRAAGLEFDRRRSACRSR